MIPVSVIIVTKNEAKRITACLTPLAARCGEVIVVDSNSADKTTDLAKRCGAQVVTFTWNGAYPKKRQWCLDNLPLRYDWVLWVDADEIVPPALLDVIEQALTRHPDRAGFFITGRYQYNNVILRRGLPNRKIALLHRHRMAFPVVDDADCRAMGEIEGHYQPIVKPDSPYKTIGHIMPCLIHDALDDERAWAFRHEKYARWEIMMNERNAWPQDPVWWRERVKKFLRQSTLRPEIMFMIAYFLMGGFLDGYGGFHAARLKYRYYKMIRMMTPPSS